MAATAPDPFFDREADFFDRRSEAGDFRERRDKFLAFGQQALKRSVSSHRPICLDLGCGPGAITISLAGLGFQAIGVDSSARMIELAEQARSRQTPELQRNVTFHRAELSEFLDGFDGAASYILSSSVFEYLQDPEGVLAGASAHLADEGAIAISLPNPNSIYRLVEPLILRRYPEDERYTSHWGNTVRAAELVTVAQGLGLEPVEVSHFGPIGLRGKALLPRLSHLSFVGTMTLVVLRKSSAAA
jgi:2-polyprenyl-3-methyl-5-hydroxy-6-metoxy-1,4-benzoquinol methylase